MSDYFTDDTVLFNMLGIEDENELKKAEEEIVAARMVEVLEKSKLFNGYGKGRIY